MQCSSKERFPSFAHIIKLSLISGCNFVGSQLIVANHAVNCGYRGLQPAGTDTAKVGESYFTNSSNDLSLK